jgi:hypothetical protein
MKIEIKPYSLGDLAIFYKIDRKTLKNWLNKHKSNIGDRHGYYYTIKQVKIIFDVLGMPGDFMKEG